MVRATLFTRRQGTMSQPKNVVEGRSPQSTLRSRASSVASPPADQGAPTEYRSRGSAVRRKSSRSPPNGRSSLKAEEESRHQAAAHRSSPGRRAGSLGARRRLISRSPVSFEAAARLSKSVRSQPHRFRHASPAGNTKSRCWRDSSARPKVLPVASGSHSSPLGITDRGNSAITSGYHAHRTSTVFDQIRISASPPTLGFEVARLSKMHIAHDAQTPTVRKTYASARRVACTSRRGLNGIVRRHVCGRR